MGEAVGVDVVRDLDQEGGEHFEGGGVDLVAEGEGEVWG